MGQSVIVITGATAGVGLAVARAYARQGARLVLLARGRERLDAAAAELAALGADVLPIPTDVADAEQVERAAALAEETYGPLDVWVNNAVATVFAPLEALTPAEFRRITEVSYLGYVYGTMAALKRMKPRDWGVVVQVSSAVAYRGIPLQSAYSGAKHAVMGFTHAVRAELIHDGSGVHLTLVHLPAVDTEHYQWAGNRAGLQSGPIPPFITAEEAAEAIVWAAAQRERETWVGGQTLQAVLANLVAPEVLDHYLAWRCYAGPSSEVPGADAGNLWEPSAYAPMAGGGGGGGVAPEPSHPMRLSPGQLGLPRAGEVLASTVFAWLRRLTSQ